MPPEAFWRLSLTEWRALTEAPSAPSLNRATLQDLIARYPDEETPP
ncbi:MAG: phage tail assembly chaperone [Caulobacter sp.]